MTDADEQILRPTIDEMHEWLTAEMKRSRRRIRLWTGLHILCLATIVVSSAVSLFRPACPDPAAHRGASDGR